MYENEIAAAALALSTRYSTPPSKVDRQYSRMLAELLELLGTLGFAGWTTGVIPPKEDCWRGHKARLLGQDSATKGEVYLDLWQQHSRLSPKHMTMLVTRADTGRGLLVGVHIGTLRCTDLRTRTTYYDDVIWAERHFSAQLRCDQYNSQLSAEPEVIARQMAAATVQLAELGITDVKHALLPKPWEDHYGITMVPYLVGMYGTMPCAVRLAYKNSDDLLMEFYLVSATGLCKLDFGQLVIGPTGKVVDSKMDIGKLLGGGRGND